MIVIATCSSHQKEFSITIEKNLRREKKNRNIFLWVSKIGTSLISCSKSTAAVVIAGRQMWLMNLATLSVD